MLLSVSTAAADENPLADAIRAVQPKMVKIYGAGGLRGLEAYQSGMLISADGYVLTANSHVLDTDAVSVVLADGRRMEAKLVAADPRLDVAVLKFAGAALPYFDLAKAVSVDSGARVLAVSNLFGVATGDEPLSVQHGTIAVKAPLEARRGVFETTFSGPVYVLDVVTNNPGAAGGAVVTLRGELVGMLGKELRNALNHTWLNYALPIDALRESVDQIRAGKFVPRPPQDTAQKPAKGMTPQRLGIVLVPDVVQRTPPYVDRVVAGSPAARAGLRGDDLVVLVGQRLVQSCKNLVGELEYVDYEDKVQLTVLRGGEMVSLTLEPPTATPAKEAK